MLSLRKLAATSITQLHRGQRAAPACIGYCNAFMSGDSKPTKSGLDILRDSFQNKGFCFTEKERMDLRLKGLIPPYVCSTTDCEQESYQEKLSWERLKRISEPFNKYDYLLRVFDEDKRQFFRLMNRHTTEVMPLVYTPTVGAACEEYSLVHQPGRGLWIPITEVANIRNLLKNWPQKDVRGIVVSDGERILGLGDLGAFGMGIPVGKLALVSGLAGIHPKHCLPIILDSGTNNQRLLDDPTYFGIRAKRTTGEAYDRFIQEFMEACVDVFGKDVLIQFEDFGNQNAFRFLKAYAPKYCLFNDDIQGTASVVLSAILTSSRITGRRLEDERIVCFGAGESMIGFANLIVETLKLRYNMTEEKAKEKLFMIDSRGLLVQGRSCGGISKEKEPFCRPAGTPEMKDLKDIVKFAKATVLIGAAAVPKVFTEELLGVLTNECPKPLVFALSNPTHKAECTALQAYKWTRGKCVFASGSPFLPLTLAIEEVEPNTPTFRRPGQANNAYIFPGVSLGIVATRIQPVTEIDFIIAAETVSEEVSEDDLLEGALFPKWDKIRAVSYAIARNVARQAFKEGRCHLKGLKESDIDRVVLEMASFPDPPDLSQLKH